MGIDLRLFYLRNSKTCPMTLKQTGVMILFRMQPVDKFMLVVAIGWALFAAYGVLMLLPFMDRRMRESEMKLKHIKVLSATPNYPQRIVFILLSCLMLAVTLAAAFHHNLSELLGINSWTPVLLMMLLPALYFALGLLKKS